MVDQPFLFCLEELLFLNFLSLSITVHEYDCKVSTSAGDNLLYAAVSIYPLPLAAGCGRVRLVWHLGLMRVWRQLALEAEGDVTTSRSSGLAR